MQLTDSLTNMVSNKLNKFLLNCQSRDNYNFISLKNGKFKVSLEMWDSFVESFFNFKHTPQKHTSLVFKWPKNTKAPLCIDVDFSM